MCDSIYGDPEGSQVEACAMDIGTLTCLDGVNAKLGSEPQPRHIGSHIYLLFQSILRLKEQFLHFLPLIFIPVGGKA